MSKPEINFRPSKKQMQAWTYLTDDDVVTEIGYGGAAYGGKSYLGCFWVLTSAVAYPDTRWVVGRESLKNVNRTTLVTLFKIMKECGFRQDVHYKYQQHFSKITFLNGSEILLMDLSNMPSDPLFARLGSLEVTGAFIDEANECPWQGIEILKTRIGRCNNDKYNLKPKILETFNPDKGHVYQLYYKPDRDNTLPKHRVFIKALPEDNPECDENYLNQLKNSDEITRQRLLFGNFEYDQDPTKLFEYDAICDLFTNQIESNGFKCITVDVARMGQDKSVVMRWDGWQLKEIVTRDKNTLDELESIILEMANKNMIPRSRIIVDEDGVGGGLVDMLKCKGFMSNTSCIQPNSAIMNPDQKLNYANLKAQCFFDLARKVNNFEIGIDATPHKMQIIEDLEQIKQKDPDKESKIRIISKQEIKEMYGKSTDFADAIMMRMYFEVMKMDRVAETFSDRELDNLKSASLRKPRRQNASV